VEFAESRLNPALKPEPHRPIAEPFETAIFHRAIQVSTNKILAKSGTLCILSADRNRPSLQATG
jgi:hypothetical protein